MPYSVSCEHALCPDHPLAASDRLPSLDIVISARDQPLGKLLQVLLGALPLARIRTPAVWIYHKGRPKPRDLSEVVAIASGLAQLRIAIGLPNVGRAEHTCVHHVAQNYARFADLTLFLKDTALAHGHLGVSTRLLAFAQRLPVRLLPAFNPPSPRAHTLHALSRRAAC